MNFYILNLIFYLALSAIISVTEKNKIKKKKIQLSIAVIQMTLIAMARGWYVGADARAWVNTYLLCQKLSWTNLFLGLKGTIYNYEPGYIILNKIVSMTGGSVTVFYTVVALIIYISVAKFSYKYSDNIWLSIFIFWIFNYQYSIGILRQTLACAICLWAADFIIERKPVQFFAIVILAMSFHTTALCIIPLYFLYKVNIDKNYLIKLSLGAGAIIVLAPKLLNLVATLIPRFKGYANVRLRYGENGGYLAILISLTCVLLGLWLTKHCRNISQQEQLMLQVMSLSFFLHLITPMLGIGRMAQYYDIYRMIFVPQMINRIIKPKQRLLVYIPLVIFGLAYYAYSLSNDTYTVPYIVFWNM